MLDYIIIALTLFLSAHATPTGNHTCTGVVKHEVTVRVNVTEPVTFRAYEWCLRVPPRCSTYTIQLKDRVKIHKEMHNRTITVCCKGYVEIDYKCVPACPPDTECPNMHCNRTNHCYCTPGYTGLYCNHPCPKGVWGAGCIKPCDCPTGYTCHYLTGDCMIDDSPPSKTRRTTTAAELLSEAATTLMTTHSTARTPTTLRTTQFPTTTTTTTTTTTRPPTSTTQVTTTTQIPTTIPTTSTTIQSTTPELTTPMVIPSTTTSTTPPPQTTTTIGETTIITQQPEVTNNTWQSGKKFEKTTTASTSKSPNTEEVATIVSTTRAIEVTTAQSTIITSAEPTTIATSAPPTTTEQSRITETPSTTSTIAPYSDVIPVVTTPQNRYFFEEIATTTTTGLPTTTILGDTVNESKTEATTLNTPRTVEPILQEKVTISSVYREPPSIFRSSTREEPGTTLRTPAPTTVLLATTTTTEMTTTEKPTTRAKTTAQRSTTAAVTPIEQTSTTEQVTTANLITTSTTQEETKQEPTRTRDWDNLNREIRSSTTPKIQEDDLIHSQPTAKPTRTNVPLSGKTTLPPAVVGDIEFPGPYPTKGIERPDEGRKYEKVGGAPEQVTVDTVQRSTTDRLDRLIIEDVPKAPQPTEIPDENPIKIVEEVISKYFHDTFLKAAIGQTNESVTSKKEEKYENPLLPHWKLGEGRPPQTEVHEFDDKAEDAVKPTSPLTTIQQSTTITTSTTPPETSTVAIVTPKVIVSGKNPDEIDLGGVIYRKMKLFPPIKPPVEYTTVPTLSTLLVIPSKEPSQKEATTPVDDRFKIYLPEYDKEAEESETTETPNIKSFMPKFSFEKEEFDYGKQAQAKKAKQKEKDLKKYKVKPHEVTNAPVDDVSKERVTNNVFLETKEFKVHLESTKSQKYGEYTKAPFDHDSPTYDLNKLAKKKSRFGPSEYEPTRHSMKQTEPAEIQNFDEIGTTQAFLETNNPTTNDKPPHTWYSHAREKAKIKSALKIMKSTMTLDMNMKPTVDSIMEESNDINAMATQYTEREPRAAVAAAVTYQDDLNNPLMFGQVKFNAPEGYAAASVSGSGADEGTRSGVLSSVAVGGAGFMAMASLLAVLWLRLKTKRSQLRKTETAHGVEERQAATTSYYETVYPIRRESDELEVVTFFCPTFTNDCAERINRELNELSYDHPRSSFAEPLYAEVLHPKIRFPVEDVQ